MKLPIFQSTPAFYYFLSVLSSNIFLSTLFSNTLVLFSFRNVRDQVPHSYKTPGKFIVLCTLTFKFLIGDKKKKSSEMSGRRNFLNLMCFSFVCDCNSDLLLLFPDISILPHSQNLR